MKNILGISAFYHDSAAALIVNGELSAAAQEERLIELNMTKVFQTMLSNIVLKKATCLLKRSIMFHFTKSHC